MLVRAVVCPRPDPLTRALWVRFLTDSAPAAFHDALEIKEHDMSYDPAGDYLARRRVQTATILAERHWSRPQPAQKRRARRPASFCLEFRPSWFRTLKLRPVWHEY